MSMALSATAGRPMVGVLALSIGSRAGGVGAGNFGFVGASGRWRSVRLLCTYYRLVVVVTCRFGQTKNRNHLAQLN